MGHMMEDFDSIGSAIGVAKMALSLQKETYIVVSGETDALDKIKEMLQRDELKLIQDDEQYLELMLEGPEAMAHITPGSLLFLVDHHRPMLCASKEVMERSRNGSLSTIIAVRKTPSKKRCCNIWSLLLPRPANW